MVKRSLWLVPAALLGAALLLFLYGTDRLGVWLAFALALAGLLMLAGLAAAATRWRRSERPAPAPAPPVPPPGAYAPVVPMRRRTFLARPAGAFARGPLPAVPVPRRGQTVYASVTRAARLGRDGVVHEGTVRTERVVESGAHGERSVVFARRSRTFIDHPVGERQARVRRDVRVLSPPSMARRPHA